MQEGGKKWYLFGRFIVKLPAGHSRSQMAHDRNRDVPEEADLLLALSRRQE